MRGWLENKTILVTGGTSGLGLELVKKFLSNGNRVITISRDSESLLDNNKQLASEHCDLSDLSEVTKTVGKFKSAKLKVDVLINNAGVLSPPHFLMTKDKFEFSYQVNFLSHYLLTYLLIRNHVLNPSLVVNVSSPIYRKGDLELNNVFNQSKYGLFKAYASTKLFMALFSQKLSEETIRSFSYNPGTFNSGIYRTQSPWFRIMYKVAAPFMTSSSRVADGLFKSIESQSWEDGKMISKDGTTMELIQIEQSSIMEFWNNVDEQLEQWLGNSR